MANPEYSLLERNRIANNMFGNVDFEIRAYSDTISSSGSGGTEITSEGYSPIEIENNLTNFPTSTLGARSNAVAFEKTFTEEATIVSIGIFTSGGDFLGRRVLDEPLEIGAGQVWRFPVGSIIFAPVNQG